MSRTGALAVLGRAPYAALSIVPALTMASLADRPGAALEPEVLALVGVQELLPQPGGGRVRGVLVDGLDVVAADRRVRRDDDLPVDLALELGALGDVEVVPVDDDRRLAGLDGRGRRVDRQEVAGLLELLEEVDALG